MPRMPELLPLVQKIAVWALPVLFAITLHEVAHGYVARHLGDNTAAAQGRLSLNPIKHIDPIGTLLVPALLLLLGGFLFGWAKAVPVNYRNLKNPKRDMAIVAVAGPAVNLLMALGSAPPMLSTPAAVVRVNSSMLARVPGPADMLETDATISAYDTVAARETAATIGIVAWPPQVIMLTFIAPPTPQCCSPLTGGITAGPTAAGVRSMARMPASS
jgi:Zn-dependent protease